MNITEQSATVLQEIDAALAICEKATAGPLQVVEGKSELGQTGDFEGWVQIEATSHRESDPVLCEIWNPEQEDVDTMKFFASARTVCPKSLEIIRDDIKAWSYLSEYSAESDECGCYKFAIERLTTLITQWNSNK